MDEKEKTPIDDVEAHKIVHPGKAAPPGRAASEGDEGDETPDVEAHKHVHPGKTVA